MNQSIAQMHRFPKYGGFTLIELMVVLIIAVLLSVAAIPFYKSFITSQRIKTASFDVLAMLTYTRNEAMKRNASVALTGNGQGMIVTVQSDGSVLRRQEPFKNIKVDCMNMATIPPSPVNCSANGNYVAEYNNNGRLAKAVLPLQLYAVNSTDTTNVSYRCITVTISGIPQSKKGPC